MKPLVYRLVTSQQVVVGQVVVQLLGNDPLDKSLGVADDNGRQWWQRTTRTADDVGGRRRETGIKPHTNVT